MPRVHLPQPPGGSRWHQLIATLLWYSPYLLVLPWLAAVERERAANGPRSSRRRWSTRHQTAGTRGPRAPAWRPIKRYAARRARADGWLRALDRDASSCVRIAAGLTSPRVAWAAGLARHQAGRCVACDHVVLPRGERIAATETRRLGRALASKTAWACSPEPHLMLRHRRLW